MLAVEPGWWLEQLELENVGPAERMEISFAPRLNLFTGDNGLGKSFLLEVAWWALFEAWPVKPALARNERLRASLRYSFFDFKSHEYILGTRYKKRQEQDYKPDVGVFISTNGDASIFVKGGGLRYLNFSRDSEIIELNSSKFLHLKPDDIFDGSNKKSKENQFLGFIEDLSLWHYKEAEIYKTLQLVAGILSPDREPILFGNPRRITARDVREIPCLVLPYGDVPITHASAGMRRILALAYLLVWAVNESRYLGESREQPIHLCLFIDEIEAHLHPAWQRLILPALMNALKALPVPIKAQIFMTTHSPMVMASTETLCADPDDGLFLFDLQKGEVRLTRQPWEKHGDASAWLQSDLFGLDEARSKPAEELVGDIGAAMETGALSDESFASLDRRIAELLPEEDPLRARWTVWKLKRAGQL